MANWACPQAPSDGDGLMQGDGGEVQVGVNFKVELDLLVVVDLVELLGVDVEASHQSGMLLFGHL